MGDGVAHPVGATVVWTGEGVVVPVAPVFRKQTQSNGTTDPADAWLTLPVWISHREALLYWTEAHWYSNPVHELELAQMLAHKVKLVFTRSV